MRIPRTLMVLVFAFAPMLARGGMDGDWGTRAGLVFRNSHGWNGQAQLRGIRWTARSGRTKTVMLAQPVNLFESGPLLAPPGEWVELTLLLDGPFTLSGQTDTGRTFDWSLDIPAFNVVLDQPVTSDGTAAVSVDLRLPDAAFPTRVRPGQAAHDALVQALQDGALSSGG